jgi:hypothetical protein
MALKTDTTISLFSQKKLLGKAHTSNKKLDGEEVIGSNIQTSTGLVFGEPIPTSPARNLYQLQGALGSANTVEYIQFVLEPIDGTAYDANDLGGGSGSDAGESSQEAGTHGYAFRLPSNYQTLTSNPRAGNGSFNNAKIIHETLGTVQLVPPFFSRAPNPYIVKIYKDDGAGGLGAEIPLLDDVDWSVDYYNGILFVQDYNSSVVPKFARAFAYIGKMSSEVIGAGGGGGTTYATNVLLETSWMETPAGAVNSVNMIFDLAEKPEPSTALQLYVNGVLQRQGASFDYTIGDKQIVMNYAPPDGSHLMATYPYVYYLPTSTQWAEVPVGLTNGSNFSFTISNTPNPTSALMLFVNGVLQRQGPGADYEFNSVTNTITMNFIPPIGSSLLATYPY